MCRVWFQFLIVLLATQLRPAVLSLFQSRTKGGKGYEQLYPKTGNIRTALGGTPQDRIIVLGIFPRTGSPYSIEYCARNCRVHFGEIVTKHGRRFPLAIPKVNWDGTLCGCCVNTRHVKHYITGNKHRFEEFSLLAMESFCKARLWMAQNNMALEVPYEVDGNNQKSLHKSSLESRPGSSANSAKDGDNGARSPPRKRNSAVGTASTSKPEEYPQIIVGAFRSTGPPFNPVNCGMNCKTAFGTVALIPGVQTILALPSISADSKTCICKLNAKAIQFWATSENREYKDLFNEAEKSYCAVNDWFDKQYIDVIIEYEGYAHPERGHARPEEVLLGRLGGKCLSGKIKTIERCTPECNKTFGWIVIYPTKPPILLPFSEAKVSVDRKACDCFLNIQPIEYYFIERQNVGVPLKFEHFLLYCKKSYDDGKKHLESLKIKVVYDDGSMKRGIDRLTKGRSKRKEKGI